MSTEQTRERDRYGEILLFSCRRSRDAAQQAWTEKTKKTIVTTERTSRNRNRFLSYDGTNTDRKCIASRLGQTSIDGSFNFRCRRAERSFCSLDWDVSFDGGSSLSLFFTSFFHSLLIVLALPLPCPQLQQLSQLSLF